MLSELTYTEARALLETNRCIALVPCGSTEAHGPHLALSTDVIIAREGALRASELLSREGIVSLVLPPIAYAVTEFAAPFAGTISLSSQTAEALVTDILRGAKRTGFAGAVLCNAHLEPEHIRTLERAVANVGAALPTRFPDVTKKPHALRLGEEFRSGACHAGEYETSLVLASAAGAKHVRDGHRALAPNPESLSRAIRAGKTNFLEAGGPNAYFGTPGTASAETGNALYAELAEIFASGARAIKADESSK